MVSINEVSKDNSNFFLIKKKLYTHHFHEKIPANWELYIAMCEGLPLARLALGIDKNSKHGLIGYFEALDSEAAISLLEAAKDRLFKLGARNIIGPINANTWHSYRLLEELEEGDYYLDPPHFFSDIQSPLSYASYFLQAGFLRAERYESRIVLDLKTRCSRVPRIAQRIERLGIKFRAIRMEDFKGELKKLYDLSSVAFIENLYYSPIDFESFAAMYLPMQALIDPEFVLMAEHSNGELIAFVLAYPDLFAPKRLVIKTLASLPQKRSLGLGILLTEEIHRRAYENGYEAVIHALAYENNVSLALSQVFDSKVFRRYSLYRYVSS